MCILGFFISSNHSEPSNLNISVNGPIKIAVGSEWDNTTRRTCKDILCFQNQLRDHGLIFSHHKKFHRLADSIGKFDDSRLVPVHRVEWEAFVLNDDLAFLHIWKNGGTAVFHQVKHHYVTYDDPTILNRTLFTVVREPISHFMSGNYKMN